VKYIKGFDEFLYEGAVDPGAFPIEAKHVGDDAMPIVHGAPAFQISNQMVRVSTVCVEIPESALRSQDDGDRKSARHLAMTGWEARQMARYLMLAADASDAGKSYQSEAAAAGVAACRCDLIKVMAGNHDPGCSKL